VSSSLTKPFSRGGPRHPARETSQLVDLARSRALDDGTGGEEQQALEQAVVPGVQQRAREPERDQFALARRAAEERGAEAEEDDADVLDAVVREQTLEVVLADRERDADDGRRGAHAEQDLAPAGRRLGEQQTGPRDPVDAGLDQHAGHHRGDVARRRGVRGRQPEVQRHDAGLEAEPDQGQREQQIPLRGRDRAGRRRFELQAAGRRLPAAEERDQEQRAGVRGGEVDPARGAHLGPPVLGRDQQECGERHDFPGDQEGDAIARELDPEQSGEQQSRARRHAPARRRVRAVPPVAEVVDGGAGAQKAHRQYEDGRQRVEAERQLGEQRAGGELQVRIPAEEQHAHRRERCQHRGEHLDRAGGPAAAVAAAGPEGRRAAGGGGGGRGDGEPGVHGCNHATRPDQPSSSSRTTRMYSR
jgi:hypothetical protein